MPPKRAKTAKRIACHAAVKKSGLYLNLKQVVAGYKKAGLPGMAVAVEGVLADVKSGMTLGDMTEFTDTARILCASAIYTLADLGQPEWIKRREQRIKQMEAVEANTHYTEKECAAYAAHAAKIRRKMNFPDGPPVKVRAKKKK